MKVLVIGSGISGMTASIKLAEGGADVTLVSPYVSERSQSVMAAGGMNAALDPTDDTVFHAEDTYKAGAFIEDKEVLLEFCRRAPEMVHFLEGLGVVFTRNEDGSLYLRLLGGHSHKRTVCAGALTGKQIVTALITKCREYEAKGKLHRMLRMWFHSALLNNGVCYGALLYNEASMKLEAFYADAVIVAAGGQNMLFGKTTGSQICDGYVQGKLFEQGVRLRNLEFIQYHPTGFETSHKKMLITEAARGEGGRLFYMDGDKRVYFMEDKYGPKGNLKPRDVVAREIYLTGRKVYLDISFLPKDVIENKLSETAELCSMYGNLDVTKEPVPITPAIHFFMGGIAVDRHHSTNMKRLYAVGECASMYHGANRLGGNSLLAALYSGTVAAESILGTGEKEETADFSDYMDLENSKLNEMISSSSRFPSFYARVMLSESMNNCLGIVRNEENMKEGLKELEYLQRIFGTIKYDSDVSVYENYRLPAMILLARAVVSSALFRKESRGAHFRSDYSESRKEYTSPSIAEYKNGEILVSLKGAEDYE